MKGCLGCLRDSAAPYCAGCRRLLFDGADISAELTFSRPDYDTVSAETGPRRLSLSGVQPKLPLNLCEGRLQIVESGGQYILKPAPRGIFQHADMVPLNEHLTMQMARQVFGFRVAANAVVFFSDGEPAYLTRRFDIDKYGHRYLQEDFAQLLGRTEAQHGPAWKYECSCEEIGHMIRKHVDAYIVDLERFVELVVFNYLVHNGDAHLKNFSVFRRGIAECSLSPAYDLLNTRLHVPRESRMALELFFDGHETDSFRLNGFHTAGDFRLLSERLGLHQGRFQRFMDSLPARVTRMESLIGASQLNPACRQLYAEHMQDSLLALFGSRS